MRTFAITIAASCALHFSVLAASPALDTDQSETAAAKAKKKGKSSGAKKNARTAPAPKPFDRDQSGMSKSAREAGSGNATGVVAPRDSASGLPTGIIQKSGKTSPKEKK